VRLILWFNRNLRVRDNIALYEAQKDASEIIPATVADENLLSPENLGKTSGAAAKFYVQAAKGLDRELKKLGSALVMRKGDSATELLRVAEAFEADGIYFTKSRNPFDAQAENRLVSSAMSMGLVVKGFDDGLIHDSSSCLDARGKPFKAFNNYLRTWASTAKPKPRPAAQKLNPLPEKPAAKARPATEALLNEEQTIGGEPRAHALWLDFLKTRMFDYADVTQNVARKNTSGISPYVAFGCVSPATLDRALCAASATEITDHARKSISAVRRSLAMRDYSVMRVTIDAEMRAALNEIIFAKPEDFLGNDERKEMFYAWAEGRTGVPIIDAGMREMNKTGWTSQVYREALAFFLVKLMRLDWRAGFLHYASALTDFDPYVCMLSWMHLNGRDVGLPRRQPIFYYPVNLSAKLDPTGKFISYYAPELAALPLRHLYTPWRRPFIIAKHYGVKLGKHYPEPIIPMD